MSTSHEYKITGALRIGRGSSAVRRRKLHSMRRAARFESLEDRCLLAGDMVSVSSWGVTLMMGGTADNDQVIVSDHSSHQVAVKQVDRYGVSRTSIHERPEVLFFNARAGNDIFLNKTSIRSVVWGGEGNDILIGGSSEDDLEGENGNDFLYGKGGPDNLAGGAGNDTLFGDGGMDRLRGGDGNDILHGGSEGDWLFGNRGNDRLYGDAGADILFGGDGADRLFGGLGQDFLSGDGGDDFLNGGVEYSQDVDHATDFVFGGAGQDLFVLPVVDPSMPHTTVDGWTVEDITDFNSQEDQADYRSPFWTLQLQDPWYSYGTIFDSGQLSGQLTAK